MTKSLCAMRHRADRDRAFFQAYYEANHAPLAIDHFPFTRYVRNHLIDGDDVPFDTISEFWADDITATAALMDGPIGDILRADEARFIDRPCITSAGAEEHILSSGTPGTTRIATLIGGGGSDDVTRAAALEWAHAVAADLPAVSLDLVIPWGVPAFPAAAILWSPEPPGGPPAALAGRVRQVRLRRCETPADHLLGNRATG